MNGPQVNPPHSVAGQQGLPRSRLRDHPLLREIIRFGIAGVMNTGWCLAILFVLHEKFHVDLWVASYTGYAIATVHSFLLNKYWTFSGEHRNKGHTQFVAFVVLNVIGSTIFSTGVNLLTPLIGLAAASLVSTVVTMVFNFIGARMLVFRRARR